MSDLTLALGLPAWWCALYILWFHFIRRPY